MVTQGYRYWLRKSRWQLSSRGSATPHAVDRDEEREILRITVDFSEVDAPLHASIQTVEEEPEYDDKSYEDDRLEEELEHRGDSDYNSQHEYDHCDQ